VGNKAAFTNPLKQGAEEFTSEGKHKKKRHSGENPFVPIRKKGRGTFVPGGSEAGTRGNYVKRASKPCV